MNAATGTDWRRRIGTSIRVARSNLGTSQDRLAYELGATRTQVVNWEAGRTRPNDERLAQIADALGQEVAWFYQDHEAGQ